MSSYYDIDAILTDAQKVPCTFDIDVPGLGYLDENPGGDVLIHFSLDEHTTLQSLIWYSRSNPARASPFPSGSPPYSPFNASAPLSNPFVH